VRVSAPVEVAADAPDMPASMAPLDAPARARTPSIALVVGEALVEQSSGRHRPQLAAAVSVAHPLPGPWGAAIEVFGTSASARTDTLAHHQTEVRPAALATVTFERPQVRADGRAPVHLALELGVGPAVTVTIASWRTPDLGAFVLAEPGARGRAALTLDVAEHLRLRAQGGGAWRPGAMDHDYTLGASWVF
jgi:hypothetical protein